MELATPVKERQERDAATAGCEDGAMSGDCGGTSASELSTCYNSSPGTTLEAEDANGSGGLSAATSATSDTPMPLQMNLPADRKEEPAVLVVHNLFRMRTINGGEFGLPRKAMSEATGLEIMEEKPAYKAASALGADAKEAAELRRTLEETRADLRAADKEAKAAEELRGQQAALMEEVQALQQREASFGARAAELEERCRREEEIAELQNHIFEVDIRRAQEERRMAAARTEALEKELKQVQKLATRQIRRSKVVDDLAAGQAALARHDLAMRSSFEGEFAPEERQKANLGRQVRRNSKMRSKASSKSSSKLSQGWFACCSSMEVAPKHA
mmetsp:Transcript_4890/g.8723  ORF Transcript_4890/g.8723 Transcript_4890/m.8723 type:complete len:331 (-) Transcript_4890:144-1136(-)|eukprot:CAMPEP_0197663310 /NCGR_PEP_ID=MMETSP1338-20131121/56911_1 /TAXON_ID=43686 ORGANISM="Pelagodinium beii, Strain RCC1491" /NCGR_SAMPLE_ID=MMETSP1338 /ASSEMBLY_ACC=CAM_ASM_000754 /LENGTH=330 /DNA_ID=CAMNT_0043241607 /DNA_START=96 /DNA_END=1088 /DNA_ORIENTATION=+